MTAQGWGFGRGARTAAVALLAALVTLSCRQDMVPSGGYERGSYWFDAVDMQRTLVSGRLLVLTHTGAAKLPVESWMTLRDRVRSRADTHFLALRLRQQLGRAPASMAAVARDHSDELFSAPHGGHFGVMRALRFPPPVVDAFAQTKPGEISEVIDTPWGFFIVERLVVPDETILAGRRLVIGSYPSQSIEYRPGRGQRTMTEARQLAAEVIEKLHEKKLDFEDAIRVYGDTWDALHGGDIGAWSTWDDYGEPTVMSALSRIEPGGITEPIITRSGIQILERTNDTEREALGFEFLVVGHAEVNPDYLRRPSARTRDEAMTLAGSLLAELRARVPLTRLRSACDAWVCQEPLGPWRRGRMDPDVEAVALSLDVGAWTEVPVSTPFGLMVGRRTHADEGALLSQSSIDATPEFPSNRTWNYDTAVERLDGPRFALFVDQFRRDLPSGFDLRTEEAEVLDTLLRSLAASLLTATIDERRAQLDIAEQQTQLLIGSERFNNLRKFRASWFKRMTQRSLAPSNH